MLQAQQVEQLLCVVSSLDRLRHIFVALCLQSQRMPEFVGPMAA
jgi:hypothetical protein